MEIRALENPHEIEQALRKAMPLLQTKAFVPSATVEALIEKLHVEPDRFTVWAGYNGGTEPVGLAICGISREADTHGVLELVYSSVKVDDQAVHDLRSEIEQWARDNELQSMSCITARRGKAIDMMETKLGFHEAARVFTRRMVK
jgi:hypothetical protein